MFITRIILCAWLIAGLSLFANAQTLTTNQLRAYLDEFGPFDPVIPTPASALGFEVGEWHVSPEQALTYFRLLAEKSDRLEIAAIGYTYERRPLVSLIFTAPENHAQLDRIRTARHAWVAPGSKTDRPPLVVWLGYSIHGNEPSGAQAALLAAYALAASQHPDVSTWLKDMVVLLDPFQNPDGLNRFAAWANANKSLAAPGVQPYHREHVEPWPNGRTNHYGFDLNRDWLPLTQPESRARMAWFHTWKPNVLTDHHEMGAAGTFFFQPGAPGRNHPLTPGTVFDLTRTLAQYHGQALDRLGSRYYTEETFDDFFFGKGSTYPDLQGGIGILFEQASSRGMAQTTPNGLLTFPFTIRNQVAVSFSTLRGAYEHRLALGDWQKRFFETAILEAKQAPASYLVFGGEDPQRTEALASLLRQHQVQLERPRTEIDGSGYQFRPETTYLIPLEQPQYRLIQALFETRTRFQDSIFYDISAWTLPLAYGVRYAWLNKQSMARIQAQPDRPITALSGIQQPDATAVAYAFHWGQLAAPRLLAALLSKGYTGLAATRPFRSGNRQYSFGDVVVPAGEQPSGHTLFRSFLDSLGRELGIAFWPIASGYTEGIQLGSDQFRPVKLPRAIMLFDEGISVYQAGAIWHAFDQRLQQPVALVGFSQAGCVSWSDFTVLVLPDGRYDRFPATSLSALQQWVQQGGVVVAFGNAVSWAKINNLLDVNLSAAKHKDPVTSQSPPSSIARERLTSAQQIGGAICRLQVDRTHPLGFGLFSDTLHVLRSSTLFFEKPGDIWSAPMVYASQALSAGYISPANLAELSGRPAVSVKKIGQGRVMGFADDLTFRAFWLGSEQVFWNAIFYGTFIR